MNQNFSIQLMTNSKCLILSIIFWVTLSACGISEEEMRATVIADLTANAPTGTYTPVPTKTELPTDTLTPTLRPTMTQTPTPEPGSFSNPAPIGMTFLRQDSIASVHAMETTLLDVRRGSEANELAVAEYFFFYEEPKEGQEYLAVKINFKWIKNIDEYEIEKLFPHGHLSLRYDEGGKDYWAEPPFIMWAEGYVPLEAEGWIFYLIRENSKPLLYFQPLLLIMKQEQERNSGVYFSLDDGG
jgi:hypothetical protein